MPTNDPIAAARREAKTRARKGSTSHQQALDAIAVENGHANWSAMQAAEAAHGPALRGPTVFLPSEMMEMQYLRMPDPAPDMPAVPTLVDIGEEAPTMNPVPTLVDIGTEAPMLEPVPTLHDVEVSMKDLMAQAPRSGGLRISEWVGERMKAAAKAALDTPAAHIPAGRAIRPLPFDAQMMAQAVDPDGGPWQNAERLVVRCPLHDDANGSLMIDGVGAELGMRCMAGCDGSKIQDQAISNVCEAAMDAVAFMRANDASRVVAGQVRGEDGAGERGGIYALEGGSRHVLGVLACRMLAEGYPKWTHD